jgi:hypothetical protein
MSVSKSLSDKTTQDKLTTAVLHSRSGEADPGLCIDVVGRSEVGEVPSAGEVGAAHHDLAADDIRALSSMSPNDRRVARADARAAVISFRPND